VGRGHTDGLQLFDATGAVVEPRLLPLPASSQAARKEGFRYFMEKEIYEQPQVLADILTGRLREDAVILDEFPAA
jgi:glutamine---fructose-6-phosphate transaminase (isomerizing)